jgi:energy-coupling factor transport system ATP-binding protein
MEDIAKYADRIIVMNKGEIAIDDKPSEVFKREEELNNMGLDIPEISKIMNMLRKKGYSIPDDVFDIKKAAEILTGEKDA